MEQAEEMHRDEVCPTRPLLRELAREGKIIRLPSPTGKEIVILR